jgi:hypothetical protein
VKSCGKNTRIQEGTVFYHMISLLDPRILSHDFPLGSSYFYHMISLLGLLYSNHAIFLLDTRIFTTWFPSRILLFFPHDFLLESLYFYHIIFLLGSSYFYHMISLLDLCIFTTWFPLWILVLLPHDFPLARGKSCDKNTRNQGGK